MIAGDNAKTITILGSTGSIGCNTVKVISESEKKYSVVALTANSNVQLLAKQAIKLNAKVAVIADDSLYVDLKSELKGTGIEAQAGTKAVANAASIKVDIVMSAIVGVAGLLPTMTAIKQGARVALANKECLVCAGEVMTDAVKKYGATLIPVDSEHSAIFQVFDFERPQNIAKIILTASGGPFRNFSKEQMRVATPAQAVAHPNWSMGDKISIDSATMMNKGLEIIEAYHLFPINKNQIEVIVHPESIIHSMVEYNDGSVLAQLGTPDMCTPISIALSWPDRTQIRTQKLDLIKTGSLTFEAVDIDKFPAIKLARQAMEQGGSMPTVLNSANEVAVQQFLKGNIGFNDIISTIKSIMDSSACVSLHSVEDVLFVSDEIGKKTAELLSRIVV